MWERVNNVFFSTILSRKNEDCCKTNLADFHVRTTLELEDITPGMFGHISSSTSDPSIEQELEDRTADLMLSQGYTVKGTTTQEKRT